MKTTMLTRFTQVTGFSPIWAFLIALAFPALAARTITGDYAGEIREKAARADGNIHVDTPTMIARLAALHINAYYFLIWHSPSDWDDFRNEFAPAAGEAGIDAWAYIVPPLECKPACSLPFGTDYVRWATEVARVSLTQPAVKGLVIDDFNSNASTFTPQYANQIYRDAKSVNPKFLIYPLVYWGGAFTSSTYFESYAQAMDGFIFAYRDEPHTNTFSTETLKDQLATVETESAAYRKPFLLMVYCAPVQADAPTPTSEYIQAVTNAGLQAVRQGKAQGVVTYLLDLRTRALGASANPAQHGNGYGMVVASGKTSPGGYGELGCLMTFQPGLQSYALTFWHRNGTPKGIQPSALFMQVIAGTTILWEADADSGSAAWKSETVSVPAAVARSSNQTLRFVLKNRAGVDARFIVYFDNLQPQGFSVSDPDFENPGAWKTCCDNPAFREVVQNFDPDQPQRLFGILANIYLNIPNIR